MNSESNQSTLRPSVRRKSSAFLSNLSRSSTSTSTNSILNISSSLPSTTSTTSLLDDPSLNNSTNEVPPVPPIPSSTNDYKTLIQKRMTTWNYLKKAHEGRVHWFNTILLPREDLDLALGNGKLGGT